MARTCPNRDCGKTIFDEAQKTCPSCGVILLEDDRPLKISDAQEDAIAKRVRKKLHGLILGELSLVGLIGVAGIVWGVWQGYRQAIDFLSKQLSAAVTEEFKTDRIKGTVKEVAASEAKTLLQSEIKPEVDAFKSKTDARVHEFETFLADLRSRYEADRKEMSALISRTDGRVQEFEKYLTDLKARYEADQQELAAQLSELTARNLIASLGDRATTESDRNVYNILLLVKKAVTDERILAKLKNPGYFTLEGGVKIPLQNQTMIATAASAEVARIKSHWLGGTTIKGWQLSRGTDGSLAKMRRDPDAKLDPPLSTKELLTGLKAEDYVIRILCAQELGGRKKLGVPDALLECAADDKNIEVSRDAFRAFGSVTGYNEFDVFGWDDASQWWKMHAEEVNAKLNEPEGAAVASGS